MTSSYSLGKKILRSMSPSGKNVRSGNDPDWEMMGLAMSRSPRVALMMAVINTTTWLRASIESIDGPIYIISNFMNLF